MSAFRGLLTNLRVRFGEAAVPFVVGGSFALAARGHPRFTDDIDVMVVVDDVERIADALAGSRFHRQGEVVYQDEDTGLFVDVIPVEDDAQRWAFDTAEHAPVEGAEGVRVLTAEGCCIMLLREATRGDPRKRPQRLRDIETLALLHELDWALIATWAGRMGYERAYGELRVEVKPEL